MSHVGKMTSHQEGTDAQLTDDDLVCVVRHPGDHRRAVYRAKSVHNPQFDTVSGGVNKPFPQPMLCGYVFCDGAIEGEVAHSGRHGPCPHMIKVVIQKNINDPRIWHALAGERYTPPRPLDMSKDAVERRRERARRAAATRRARREQQVDMLSREIASKWPHGRIPSAERLAETFETYKTVAADARRKAVAVRQE